MISIIRYRLCALLLLSLLPGACGPDPVHDDAVARLGEESAAGAGELHRAGQPCATCHNAKNGPASSDFSVAGTVFDKADALVGVDGAKVEIVDSAGTSPPPIGTNCVGNFWIQRARWNPVLPIVSVRVSKNGVTREMKSPIGGAASCADCHSARLSAEEALRKAGPVFVFDEGAAAPAPSPNCPVDPTLRIP